MRTSGVKLVAETSDYKRGMDDAADATDKAKDSIDDLARSAPKAKVGLDSVGRAAKATGRDVKELERDLAALDRQIMQTDAGLLSLSKAFARTGDPKMLDEIGKQQTLLRQLTSVRKRLADAGNDGGKTFADRFTASASSLLAKAPLSPPLMIAATAAAVAASPVLGAAISGAVIGGAGLGGMAGGLLLASKDYRVQQAANEVGQRLENRLNKAGAVFVKPAIDGMHEIEKSIDNVHLERIFANSSQLVVPLARNVGQAIESIGKGLDDLVANSGRSVDAIGSGIASIGDHLGHGLSELSDNGEDAARALALLAAVVNSSMDSLFGLVDLLSKTYGLMHAIGADWALQGFAKIFGPDMDSATAAAQKTYSAAANAASGIDKIGGAAAGATPAIVDMDKATEDAATSFRDLYSATTNTAGAIANAKKTIDENGKALSINSAKGRENRAALSDVAAAMVREHQAAVNMNQEGAKSAAVSEKNRAAFIRLAEKAGYSASQAKNLATQLGLIPTRRETQINVQTAQAEAKAKRVRDLLAGIHNRTVSVNVLINESRIDKVNNQLDRLGRNEFGGPVFAGVPSIVGERRPEVFTPTMDGMIHSSEAAFAAQHTAMARGGMIREPIFGVGKSGRTYSFGEQGIPEAVTPMNRTYQAARPGMVIQQNKVVNVTVTAPVGSHPREIGAAVVGAIGDYLEGGGELRVRGQKVL